MKLRLLTILAALAIILSAPAHALTLDEARGSGLVGEKIDGYVAAMKQTPDVIALVNEVNQKRRQEYLRISSANGQPVSVVGKLAAEQIMNRLRTGAYYQGADGKWRQR